MPIKVYLAPDSEFKDMSRLVIEQEFAGKTKETEGQRCHNKESAIRRGMSKLQLILNRALLSGDTIKIEIDTGE